MDQAQTIDKLQPPKIPGYMKDLIEFTDISEIEIYEWRRTVRIKVKWKKIG